MTLAAHIATAEAHAKACYEALERHCGGRDTPICGCFIDRRGGRCVVAEGCELGQVLKEEYEIASRRVRELRETGRIDRMEREDMNALMTSARGTNTHSEAVNAQGGTTCAGAHGVPSPGSFGGLENREEVIAKPSTNSRKGANQ